MSILTRSLRRGAGKLRIRETSSAWKRLVALFQCWDGLVVVEEEGIQST